MGDLWGVRRARAIHLIGRMPHAEEILAFYGGLSEAQERVADRVPVMDWLGRVRSDEGDFPSLHVERLPLDGLALPFRDFLSNVAEFGTETIKDGAQTLISRNDDGQTEALRAAVHAWKKADDLSEKADDPSRRANEGDDLRFYGRAFLEAVITSIALADSSQPADWTRNSCFACAGIPQVAVLRDLPDAVGHRSLICSMCATEWRFQRLTCPYCGETEASKLPVHTAESIDHVRVDACNTCSRYIKTVDLRKDGNAIPVVDELAAVELDIWAREQGLTKLRANVAGL